MIFANYHINDVAHDKWMGPTGKTFCLSLLDNRVKLPHQFLFQKFRDCLTIYDDFASFRYFSHRDTRDNHFDYFQYHSLFTVLISFE